MVRAQAALALALAAEPETPAAAVAEPTRGSALRAAAAISDSLGPAILFDVEVDETGYLRVKAWTGGAAAEVGALLAFAGCLDSVTSIRLHDGGSGDKVHVWVDGTLAETHSVHLSAMLDGSTAALDELLAPVRALAPADPAVSS